jgi:two-component sensor histidine kinase
MAEGHSRVKREKGSMDRQPDSSVPLSDALTHLKAGDHFCLIHEGGGEGLFAASLFISIGIARGDRCIAIVDGTMRESLAATLARDGVDVDAALGAGLLVFLAGDEPELSGPSFEPDRFISFLKESLGKALGDGFQALRVVSDMSWILKHEGAIEKLVEYELKLNAFLLTHACIVMCQYDRNRFPASTILDMIRAHTLISTGGRAAGNPFFIHRYAFGTEEAESREVDNLLSAIIEQRMTEEARRISLRVLEAANLGTGLPALLNEFVVIVADYTGCRAVGIRLLDDEGNIPYQAYTGFSESFYNLESPLSVSRDKCMCINVILGATDPGQPFYTSGGSFCMNATTKFLATVSEEDKGSTRNTCNLSGYESVALVPIRKGSEIIGLVHLADTRENMVPPGAVKVLEDVAVSMGNAIQRVAAERKVHASLEEKEVLLREVHHRVKNNLATIIGLLNLHVKEVKDPDAKGVLTDLGGRIRSMALIHEFLYRSESLSRIHFQEYLKALASHLRTTFGSGSSISIRISADVHMALDDALPCGMIINELITNALKYAFPDKAACRGDKSCEISVEVSRDGDVYTVKVRDNGVGLPGDLSLNREETLGLRLVRMLGQHQLGGEMDMDFTDGTRFSLSFPSRGRR